MASIDWSVHGSTLSDEQKLLLVELSYKRKGVECKGHGIEAGGPGGVRTPLGSNPFHQCGFEP